MNSVKIAYIICSLISDLAFLALAVLAPICLTPGYYWWTAGAVCLFFASGVGFTERVNSWGDLGKTGN